MPPALIAVDWGTSSLRGALLGADGSVLDELQAARGLLTIPPGGWDAVFDEVFGPWLQGQPGLTSILSGMVGSQQGWREAAYCPCPATLQALGQRLCWVRPGRVAIVPGVVAEAAAPAPADGPALKDVMRGEETQVFGALALLGLQDAEAVTVVLPGTHSKWVQVQRGCITGLATQMTGECHALFRQHSILARTLPAPGQPPGPPAEAGTGRAGHGTLDAARDDALDLAFDAGVARAQQPGGLLHHLFAVRTQALFAQRSAEALAHYLSGLVIGEELRARFADGQPTADPPLVLMGSDALTARYQRALASLGVAAQRIGAGASWAGLLAIARQQGLVT